LLEDKELILDLLEKSMRTAEELVIVPSSMDEGILLEKIGKIAAILYYPVPRDREASLSSLK